MALGHLHGLRWQPKHWASLWPCISISTDHGCGRATNSGTALGSKVDLDFTRALGCKRTFHIRLFLTASLFLQCHLFSQRVDDSTSLSLPFLCHILTHHNGTYPTPVLRTQAGLWVACAHLSWILPEQEDKLKFVKGSSLPCYYLIPSCLSG